MDYNLSTNWTVVLIIAALWELGWKGVALWKSAHRNQNGWFIAILLINTAGLLPNSFLAAHIPH